MAEISVEFISVKVIVPPMHRLLMVLFLIGSFSASAADTATGRVVKVLPLVLDLKGRAALSPSLFDRDAYQAYLRLHTNEISAVRFDVLWSTSHADRDGLKVRWAGRLAAPDHAGAGGTAPFLPALDVPDPGWRGPQAFRVGGGVAR